MNNMTRNPEWDTLLSNFNRHLNIRIVAWREGEVTVELTVADFMRNRHGLVHGGVIATLIDAAAGYAGNYCPHPGRQRLSATIALTTSFLAPGRDGKLIAKARVRGGGRSIFASDVEVTDEAGQILAIGQASCRYMKGSETPEGVPVEAQS
jgi:uncharacterized protein (TIGR00369 family)